jgi:hypothetical protein
LLIEPEPLSSRQALLMTMRVASPVGRRVGNVGGEVQHSGSFELLSVVERIVDDIIRQIIIFPKWRERPCSSRRLVRSVGTFRSLPSGKLVSQTSRPVLQPAFPQLKPKALTRNEVAKTTPLHSTSNVGSVPERWLARMLLVRPFAINSLSFHADGNSIRARFVTPVNLDLRTSKAALIQPRVLMCAAFHCPQEN